MLYTLNKCHIALYCTYIVSIKFFFPAFWKYFWFIQSFWFPEVVFLLLYFSCFFCVVQTCFMQVVFFVLYGIFFLYLFLFCFLKFSVTTIRIYVSPFLNLKCSFPLYVNIFIYSKKIVCFLYQVWYLKNQYHRAQNAP